MNQFFSSDLSALDVELGDLSDVSRGAASPADALSPARDLVALLRGGAAGRCKLGFLSLPPQTQSTWHDLAAQLGCDLAFLPSLWLERLAPGARFASISAPAIGEVLDALAQNRGTSDVCLVAGLDLLLCRLDPMECARFWSDLPSRFPHRPTALILSLPHSFARFGPDLVAWEKVAARLT